MKLTDADHEILDRECGPANIPQRARREVIYRIAFRAGMKRAAALCDEVEADYKAGASHLYQRSNLYQRSIGANACGVRIRNEADA